MFIDVADCSVKDRGDVFRMLKMIHEISEYCDIILSVNHNEFQTTTGVLEEFDAQKNTFEENKMCKNEIEDNKTSGNENIFDDSWNENAKHLYDFCGLKYLCVHLRDSAYGYDGSDIYCTKNKLIKNPKVSTGGGDNFNAGLLYGLLTGLDLEGAMITGNAASGFYITQGHGASREELVRYLNNWAQELV